MFFCVMTFKEILDKYQYEKFLSKNLDMINSENLQKRKAVLPVFIGVTRKGNVLKEDLTKMPHLLLTGRTGQGKSMFLHGLISTLTQLKAPGELQFVLIDTKMIEFPNYQNIPLYLYSHKNIPKTVITDMEDSCIVINALHEEMDQRYSLLNKAKCRSISDFNSKIDVKLPYIVLVIDELADLIMVFEDGIENPLFSLLTLGKAVGIHVVIATARPCEPVLSGRILANLPTNIMFDTDNINYVINGSDIEWDNLPNSPGEALYISNGEHILIRTPYIDEDEIKIAPELCACPNIDIFSEEE